MISFQRKHWKTAKRTLGNENGSAIVIALLILLAVTIMGITSSNTSITELFISGNDVVKKASFFHSDAGLYAVPKVISKSINDRETPWSLSPPFTFTAWDSDPELADDFVTGKLTFYRELSGLEDPDDDEDISFQNDGIHTTGVDVRRLGSYSLVGGGAEFGSAAEGHGTSMNGIRYIMSSTGRGQKNAVTELEARYLKVIGTAGGL